MKLNMLHSEKARKILNLYNRAATPGEKEAARQAYIRVTGVDPANPTPPKPDKRHLYSRAGWEFIYGKRKCN